MKASLRAAIALFILPSFFCLLALAQPSQFTYQGFLGENGVPAAGVYDLQFGIYDLETGGTAVGGPLTNNATAVSNGLFTVTLDFGSGVFDGGGRWLEVGVVTNGGRVFDTLSPRQQINSTPYAMRALTVGSNALASYAGAVSLTNPSNTFAGDGSALSNISVTTLGGLSASNFWRLGGNAGTTAGADYATIAGGRENVVDGVDATVGGGSNNEARGSGATTSGGINNRVVVSTPWATISGVYNNTATGTGSPIGGGNANTTTNSYSTVAGGQGNTASKSYAMVSGGADNVADGTYAFAAGRRAKANHSGALVWGDSYDGDVGSTNHNSVTMRASGGYRLFSTTNTTGAAPGVELAAGATAWATISDRNAKKNFAPVAVQDVLGRLAELPIQRWNYKTEADDAVPHIGPMAQDFKAAFCPGRDDRSITTLEFDGVALAAIQGLNQKVEVRSQNADVGIRKLKEENAGLKRQLEDRMEQKETEIAELRQQLREIRKVLNTLTQKENSQ